MREALGILLDGACYHGFTFFEAKKGDPDVALWNKALDKKATKDDWIALLEGRGYRSAVDYPPALFYK